MRTHQHLDDLKNDMRAVRADCASYAAVLPVKAVPVTGADEQSELLSRVGKARVYLSSGKTPLQGTEVKMRGVTNAAR